MLSIVLICCGLVADDGARPAAKATPDRPPTRRRRKAAGQDAAANVRLALWCEQHGMTAERMKHLATAVLHDPSNGLARGLLGLVAYDGKWEPPDEVSRKAQDDPKRQGADAGVPPSSGQGTQQGRRPGEAGRLVRPERPEGPGRRRTYHAVLRLDPRREAAWKHLGFKKSGGQWVKPEWQEAAKREADEQGRANKHWKPILEKWRSGSPAGSRRGGQEAEAGLAGVTDPRAVPMIWAVFVPRGCGGPEDGRARTGADRLAGVVAGTGAAGPRGASRPRPAARRSQILRRARPAGLRSAADRTSPRPDQVRGQAGERAGEAR